MRPILWSMVKEYLKEYLKKGDIKGIKECLQATDILYEGTKEAVEVQPPQLKKLNGGYYAFLLGVKDKGWKCEYKDIEYKEDGSMDTYTLECRREGVQLVKKMILFDKEGDLIDIAEDTIKSPKSFYIGNIEDRGDYIKCCGLKLCLPVKAQSKKYRDKIRFTEREQEKHRRLFLLHQKKKLENAVQRKELAKKLQEARETFSLRGRDKNFACIHERLLDRKSACRMIREEYVRE